jgi:hypothetical protein
MVANDLSTLMREGEHHRAASAPDLAEVRRLGARRRLVRRAVPAVGALGAAAVVAGAVLGGTHGLGGLRDGQVTAQDHHVTGLSAYERRVLAAVSGSYAVDGTVIVPETTRPWPGGQPMPASRFTSPVRRLGFDTYAKGSLGYSDLPAFMQGNPPADSQVVADSGAAYLACTSGPDSSSSGGPGACVPSVLSKYHGRYVYDYGLGADGFLKPSAPMEVFTDADYSQNVFRATLIGGFAGTSATRVEITTVDGERVAAQVDRGGIRVGATLFWASLPSDAARVTAYDAGGHVVVTHLVRACHSPVDCEVR